MKEWTLKEVIGNYGQHLDNVEEGRRLMDKVDEELRGNPNMKKRRTMLEHLLRHWLGKKGVVRHF